MFSVSSYWNFGRYLNSDLSILNDQNILSHWHTREEKNFYSKFLLTI